MCVWVRIMGNESVYWCGYSNNGLVISNNITGGGARSWYQTCWQLVPVVVPRKSFDNHLVLYGTNRWFQKMSTTLQILKFSASLPIYIFFNATPILNTIQPQIPLDAPFLQLQVFMWLGSWINSGIHNNFFQVIHH